MHTKLVVLVCASLAVASAGCKKKGGGGGGGWFVGTDGMMASVHDETLESFELGASETLEKIACRYSGEAWVVGTHGTLLYTNDGGEEWTAETLPTTANLHAIATQDAGPVFVAGDGVLFTAIPDFATGAVTWTQLADGTTPFVSVAAAQRGTTVLAVSADGSVWSIEHDRLVKVASLPGTRTVAVSPDGTLALAAGAGLARSTDGGRTWTALTVDPTITFDDARIGDRGDAIAVGSAGAVALVDAAGAVLTQRVGTAHLHALHLPGVTSYGEVGYAGGDGGQIWITRDGGWTWTAGPNVGHTVLGVDEIGDGHR